MPGTTQLVELELLGEVYLTSVACVLLTIPCCPLSADAYIAFVTWCVRAYRLHTE